MTFLRTLPSRIAPMLRKFSRYAFLPNFTKSLQPFADAYYNFGRMLVEVFSKVGLIDTTHPWLRSTMRTRPVEVLSYACARADWKKPLSLPTVMAASITLMVACGALVATGLFTSSMLGVGQAYAGMFTAPSPGTDLALKYMSNSFGVTIPGVPLDTLDGVVSGFQKMMGIYSMCMLVLAGFVLLYILTSAVAATAHEGRFGGSGFNQIWAPIRLIVAIGLLVPLPMPDSYNGYNSGQYIVMKIAEFGSGMATNLWVPFATALAKRGDVIATPNVPAAASTVMGVLRNEFCRDRYNRLKYDLLLSDPTVELQTFDGTAGETTVFYTTSGDTQNNYCGSTTYTKPIDTGTMATAISNSYQTAYFNMRDAAAALAHKLNDENMINIYTALPSAGQEDATKIFFTKQFVSIVDDYQTDLANAIKSTTGDQANASNDAMTSSVTNSGWAGAGMWFNTIARLNAEIMAAARAIPTSQPPQLQNATTAASNIGVVVNSNLTDKINGGLEVLNQYAQNLPGNFAAAGVAPDAGTHNMSGVFTPSVTSGLASEGYLYDKMSEGSAFIGTIMKVLGKFIGGPFGEIGFGADAGISQINPLAQLAAIGNWLLNVSMAAVTAAVMPFLPTGLVFVLLAIATTTFSAGILLFYVTPLIPFIRLLFSTMGWLLNILEAVIAIPLVAVAHLNTSGGGVSGDLARTAYFMVLSVFLRPALLIVGMVTALMMFTISIGVLNDLYKSAVVGFMGSTKTSGGLSTLMYTVMYCVIAYSLCNLCFKLIEEIPNHAMRWIGQNSTREITQDEGAFKAMTGGLHHGFVGVSGNMVNARGRLLSRAPK